MWFAQRAPAKFLELESVGVEAHRLLLLTFQIAVFHLDIYEFCLITECLPRIF